MQNRPAIGQDWFSKHVFADLKGLPFYLAVLGVVVFCIVVFFVLNALPPQARRRLIIVSTFIGGLYYALEFFIPAQGVWLFGRLPVFRHNPLTGYLQPLAQFLRVLGGFAVGLGLISLFTVHGHRIARQRAGWGNSLAFFIAFAAITLFGFWQHFDTGKPPAPTPNLLRPTLYSAEPLIESPFALTRRQRAQLEELPSKTTEAPEIAAIQEKLADPKLSASDKKKAEKAMADTQKALENGIADILTDEQEELKKTLEDKALQTAAAEIAQKVGEKYQKQLTEEMDRLPADLPDETRSAMQETMQTQNQKEKTAEMQQEFLPHLERVLTEEQRARLHAAIRRHERGERRGQFAKDTYNVLFNGMFNSLDATMFAILAFFIVSAAYRAFRVRSAEATLMMLSAFIIMLGQVPIGIVLTNWIPRDSVFAFMRLERMANWILTGINAAAFRAIIFGILMGYLAMALRVWLSLERGAYLGRD